MKLSELKKGDIAKIVQFDDNQLELQLNQLGFLIGETVQYLNQAPMGDPICVATIETKISLRKNVAATILVQKVVTA